MKRYLKIKTNLKKQAEGTFCVEHFLERKNNNLHS